MAPAAARVKINPALAALVVPIDELHEDPGNVRVHPDRNLATIEASLRQFGQQKPIVVDPDGKIVAGNGTYRAALMLGATEIAAVPFTEPPVRATAYALADNRSAELAAWDTRGLGEAFAMLAEEGVDLNSLGWADFEIDPLLRGALEPPEDGRPDESSRAGVRPVSLTKAQRERFELARDRLREYAGEEITEGGCVAQLADYWTESMATRAPVE